MSVITSQVASNPVRNYNDSYYITGVLIKNKNKKQSMYEEAECACFPKNKEKKIQTWRGRKAKKEQKINIHHVTVK